jgi:predicted small lipoprotein YifL
MLTRAATIVAFALLLSGCGQKGPLYLPDRNGTVVTSPAANPPGAQPQAPADGTAPQTAPTQSAPKKTDSDDDSPPPQ